MAAKKTTKKSPKKTVARTKAKQEEQLASSVGPLLTIVGVLALATLLLGYYVTLVK